MRILIATDTFRPQINGVVRSLEAMERYGAEFGASFDFVTPEMFRTVPLPSYPELRLARVGARRMGRIIDGIDPDYIHIATEGPIGIATRRACLRAGRGFTTAYHTRFPEYISRRAPIPERVSYEILRRFHSAGGGTLVATSALERDLRRHGFSNLTIWSRGVDTDLYRPRPDIARDLPGPVFLYVGRVAVEKDVEAFLRLDLPGTKMVVGDGPERERLAKAYPQAVFRGPLEGEALALAYASSDVFVFPSRTDTFGMVLLEALASGLPVAAHPVMGPAEVIGDSGCGVLDEDLRAAALGALGIKPERCREHAMRFSWRESARTFLDALERGGSARPSAVRGER